MTAPVIIKVPRANPPVDVEVRAWLTLTPGLVVHPSIGDPGWVVAHQRSGLLIGWTHDPESAHAMAVELGAIADWTLSGEELRRQVLGDGGARAREIVAKGQPRRSLRGEPVDRNVLA